MVNLNSGIPFKSGCGYVVIVPDADNGRVWIETGKNGIFDYRINRCGDRGTHGFDSWGIRDETVSWSVSVRFSVPGEAERI